MKYFIRQIVLFIITTIGVYALLLLCWSFIVPVRFRKNLFQEKRGDYLSERLQELTTYKKVDILFIGSSHVYRSFDVRVFKSHGYNTFNLGCSAQTPYLSLTLLKIYLKQLNPKVVVLETFPHIFETDDVESDLNLIINGINMVDHTSVIDLLKRHDIILLNSFASERLKNILHIKTKVKGHNFKYIPGGYVESHIPYNRGSKPPYLSHVWQPKRKQLNALLGIIEFLRVHNVKLILVQSPVRRVCYNYLYNTDKIDHFFCSKGLYYNFNKILNLDDTTFFDDTHHLNKKGAKIFDEKFIKVCLENNEEINMRLKHSTH